MWTVWECFTKLSYRRFENSYTFVTIKYYWKSQSNHVICCTCVFRKLSSWLKLGADTYFGHIFNWNRLLLRKIDTMYIVQNIFHHFLQLFLNFLATWQYRGKRTILVWYRSNHRPIFALLQQFETEYQPTYAAFNWTAGNQSALRVVSTLGAGRLNSHRVSLTSIATCGRTLSYSKMMISRFLTTISVFFYNYTSSNVFNWRH